MPNLIIFKGMNQYKDKYANEDVIRYVLESSYYELGYSMRNIIGNNKDCEYIIPQFALAQSIRPDTDIKLHHFVLAINEKIDDDWLLWMMEITCDYFGKKNFQVIAAYHYGSNKRLNYPHIHVIVNHVNLNGELFYGNDSQYGEFLDMLRLTTGMKWNYIYDDDKNYRYSTSLNPVHLRIRKK